MLLLITVGVDAEIKFRSTSPNLQPSYRVKTYTPSFKLTPTRETTNRSYITHETHHNRYEKRVNLYNSNQSSYYHRYTPEETKINQVAYNKHITMSSYNPANNQPFDGGAAVINTAPVQYAFGPPAEGPISDFIIPMLLFIGLYIIRKLKLQ